MLALRAWLQWVNNPKLTFKFAAPEEYEEDLFRFNPRYGLCSNLSYYVEGVLGVDFDLNELAAHFAAEGLHMAYPFCTEEEYNSMHRNKSQNSCEARLNWVKSKLEKYDAATK